MSPAKLLPCLALLTLAASGCPGPDPTGGSGGSDTGTSGTEGMSTGPTPTPPGSTGVPTGSATGGSTGDTTGPNPTSGPMDTTMGEPTTTSPGTTTDASSSGTTGIPECIADGDCGNNEACVGGSCEEACGGTWGTGNYGTCLTDLGGIDVDNLCGPPADNECLTYGSPIEASGCSVQACASRCDCPAPAMTGDAVVTCGDISGDGVDDCYLSCANGETCPDDMACRDNEVCVTELTADLPMWGNCGNLGVGCAPPAVCVIENGYTGCIALCPGGVGDCDAAPPGANPEQCQGVIFPPNGADCILPCVIDADCPTGMECYDDPSVGGSASLCMWPMNTLIGGGTCCVEAPMGMGGCAVPEIELCTCTLDAFCCDNTWDQICVDLAISDCYMSCI